MVCVQAICAKNGPGLKILAIVCQILFAAAFVGPHIRTKMNGCSTTPCKLERSCSTTALAAGGFGGGSAVKSKSKNSKSKKTTSSASFDVSAAIARMEKKYEELQEADAKRLAKDDGDDDDDDSSKANSSDDIVTTEYVVAVRPSQASNSAIPDWVPIGQLILARKNSPSETNSHHNDDDSRLLLHTAVSLYCRELAHLAVLGSRVFSNIPRNQLEYSVEASGSFYKYVYERVSARGSDKEDIMTNAEARKILGFEPSTSSSGIDRSTLRKKYRSLSMEWHPDRMIGESEEKQLKASDHYTRIKQAYETLAASGTMSNTLSWYESLGGRERTDFFKVEGALSPIAAAQETLELRGIESAVAGLDPDFVQGFVARSSSRSNV